MSGDGLDAKASKGRKKARGTVRNEDRLEAFTNRGSKGHADWSTCDSEWIQAVIVGITMLGGAVTFGLSRDQGAHSMTLLLDDKRQPLWYNGDADLSEELEKVVHTIAAIS